MIATKKQIEEWKAKHGGFFSVEVEGKIVYLKAPSVLDWKRLTLAIQEGEVKFAETCLDLLWLDGDQEIKTDEDCFLGFKAQVGSLFDYEEAEVEKVDGLYKISLGEEFCLVRSVTRKDLELADKKNPSKKPFVSQEILFEIIKKEASSGFDDKNNASLRIPLYKAIETIQNKAVAVVKKY
ncbi:MAG: hypothetical protein C4K58_06925 [Flavobacteriaceae bacterium]|nr:MAG: hypothetical protein C4K58_06925 [Flavobacteriaceae bacterium]